MFSWIGVHYLMTHDKRQKTFRRYKILHVVVNLHIVGQGGSLVARLTRVGAVGVGWDGFHSRGVRLSVSDLFMINVMLRFFNHTYNRTNERTQLNK